MKISIMKRIAISIVFALLSFICFSQAHQEFKLNVKRIDPTKQTAVDIETVKIIIGGRTSETVYRDSTDTMGTVKQYQHITSHAIDSLEDGEAIIVRHHRLPLEQYKKAFTGYDPETNKPTINILVLKELLKPYNLTIR